MLDSTEAFRPFQNWQGEAATAVEANFEQFRQWVYQIADLCKQLVAQVQGISSAHSWAVTQHPTVAQLPVRVAGGGRRPRWRAFNTC
nr:PPE domain-containing protein [Mycobacterium marinum]